MRISYKKLWKMLIDRDMNRKDLRKMTGISSTAIAKMGKCENVNTDILLRICVALKCDISEIMEIEHDEPDINPEKSTTGSDT
jgi:DNA-binding Xre family transcriptional regulator